MKHPLTCAIIKELRNVSISNERLAEGTDYGNMDVMWVIQVCMRTFFCVCESISTHTSVGSASKERKTPRISLRNQSLDLVDTNLRGEEHGGEGKTGKGYDNIFPL